MKTAFVIATIAAMIALGAAFAAADTTFTATLSGLEASPANASPGTGFGTVVLNTAETQITVDLSWTGLLAAATASHIHGPALPGVNNAIVFPFSGVPAVTAGSILEQVFTINATQVNYLKTGQLYFNVHTSVYPGGEIRGQIYQVPEPGSLAALGLGLVALAGRRRFPRRK